MVEAESELGQPSLGSESRMQGNLSFDGESPIVDGEFKPTIWVLHAVGGSSKEAIKVLMSSLVLSCLLSENISAYRLDSGRLQGKLNFPSSDECGEVRVTAKELGPHHDIRRGKERRRLCKENTEAAYDSSLTSSTSPERLFTHQHGRLNTPSENIQSTMATFLRRLVPANLPKSRLLSSPTFTMSARSYSFNSYFVTPAELDKALKKNAPSRLSTAPKTVPVCGSWFLPNDGRNGYEVFKAGHIHNARFFDLDKIADTSSPYPHMLPSPEVFKDAMSNLGIKRDDTVVVYDTAELGIFSAPRVAWTFKVFGHPTVHILNNFRLWVEQGYPTEEGEPKQFEKTEYPMSELDKSKVVAFEEIRNIAFDHNKEGSEGVQVLDARSLGRFKGTEPEPRPGLSSGHMPGSTSVPVPELLDPTTKTFLPAEELQKIFQQKGIDPKKPVISSCGTGVTATVIDAALIEAGYGDGR